MVASLPEDKGLPSRQNDRMLLLAARRWHVSAENKVPDVLLRNGRTRLRL
jgi:hypothetical protein